MRAIIAALSPPLLCLAACGGGGVAGTASAGSAAPVAGASGGAPAAAPAPAPSGSNMFDVAETTTFKTLSAGQSLTVTPSQRDPSVSTTFYRGNANTPASSASTITYDPRNGIFTVALSDGAIVLNKNLNFQDPAHRTAADVARSGQYQVPLLTGFNYLQATDGLNALGQPVRFTFFYRRPGTDNAFVSLAGYERSDYDTSAIGGSLAEQGVMVFGARTPDLQVPTRGTGRYEGQFLASMVGMDFLDGTTRVLQWIDGTSAADVDFARRTVGLTLTGRVQDVYVKTVPVPSADLVFPSGALFTATGQASWTGAGGTDFAGRFSSAGFEVGGRRIAVDFTPVAGGTGVTGASSIDGTFYGPSAQNVGGNFRIVGGVPNQRIDIVGAFTGAKK